MTYRLNVVIGNRLKPVNSRALCQLSYTLYHHNPAEERNLLDRRIGWRFASNQLLTKLQYDFRY